MKLPITERFGDHYRKTYATHGSTPQGVDWKDRSQAQIRYAQMFRLFQSLNSPSEPTILDVGCGYGAFFDFLRSHHFLCRYTGIDIVDEMLEQARQGREGTFLHCSLEELKAEQRFDYVVCNGLFTQRLQTDESEMNQYIDSQLTKLFSHCNCGVVANFLTDRVDFRTHGNHYCSPESILQKSLELTPSVELNHSYPLFEFSIYLYRRES